MAIAGFEHIGVIGAGQMGAGIAQVAASSGLSVKIFDLSSEQLTKAKNGINASVAKLIEKGKLSTDAKRFTDEVKYVNSLKVLTDCDLVIEAIVENEDAKKKVFTELGQYLSDSAVIASNTSSIPITRLAASTKNPETFIGMHFMNPVPIMQLVEVIPGFATDPAVTERVKSLANGFGKQVSLSKDFPGFVVNRILMPMINEAFNTLLEGVATAEDIDLGMKLGTNQPMGPLTLADFIGLDTCLAIMEVLYQGTYDPRFRPSPLLRKYVEAGFYGRKSRRGVYTY